MFLRWLFKRRAPLDARKVSAELEALGWFRYVSEAARPVVRDQVEQSLARLGIPEAEWLEDEALPPSTSDRRIYMADAEELAEGNVHQVLLAMRDALAKENVHLGTVVSDASPQRYDLIVDGTRYAVFAPGGRNDWYEATCRLVEITNGLLIAAGAEARLYAQSPGGNEGAVMLLTPALHQSLKKLGVPKEWLPQEEARLRKQQPIPIPKSHQDQ